MSVGSAIIHKEYLGTGSTATYAYPWKIISKNYLRVFLLDALGVKTVLTVDVDYTVTNVGDVVGGQVILTAGNLAAGTRIFIRRTSIFTQPYDIRNQGDFSASILEDAIDYAVMLICELSYASERAVKLPEEIPPDDGDPSPPTPQFDPTLPVDLAASAGKLLAVNGTGDGWELVDP